MSPDDAAAFSAALERALADPDRRAKEAVLARELAADVAAAFRRHTGEELPSALADRVESVDATLGALIRLGAAGGFRID